MHIKTNKARDKRIAEQILADTYSEEEAISAWRCHIEDAIKFPFTAICVKKLAISALKKGEVVEVLGIAPEDEYITDIFVIIEWQGHKLGVPLVQLKPVKSSPKTKQVIEDWRYYMRLD